ncbi:ABC transporter permease [Mahella sp.]|uniref:ABC transporter permease n=1 Tax=Mahella sp. TaxID=2798721 RepID=UPI0025BFC556|nr:ABC transporter permease [Mahella sp.]MBZ4665682.1 transporter permease [Mahella sp.]MDK2992264.1 bacitracin transport system permease protein [Clostridiales bacterium]
MRTLLWAERLKLKRSKILWIAVFSAIMVTFIVFMQGQFQYYGHRYIDKATWYMTATQSLGSLYVFPAIIALMGSYMICREDQDDTMKSLVLVPVSISNLIRAKLIITSIFSVVLYTFLFVVTLTVEAALHISLLDFGMVLGFAKIYLLEGICLFVAVSPVIAVVYGLKKGYWLALIFAEMYSFLGLFIGQSTMRFIYPITAAFCVAGYYETTTVQFVISLCSLLACGGLSLLLLHGLNRKRDIY